MVEQRNHSEQVQGALKVGRVLPHTATLRDLALPSDVLGFLEGKR